MTLMSRIGQAGSISLSHTPACHQQPPRAGRDGIGAAIERRMLHRRQRSPIDHCRGNAGRSQPAGQRAAHRARSHHANLYR